MFQEVSGVAKRLFIACSFGMVISFILILIAAFFLTSILKWSSLSEASLTPLSMMILSLIALFIGGVTAGAKMKEKGLVTGACTGLFYSAVIYLALFLGFDRTLAASQMAAIVANTAVTAMGGIIGVNLFVKK